MFTRDQFCEETDEAGVLIGALGRALVTFCAMQDHTVSVAEAATVFNTTPDVIREAVDTAMWISVDGPDNEPMKQQLELEGA
jgi:hypothetical protein